MTIIHLTVAVAAAIVLVLAGYLIAIAWALARARRNVAQLADGLEIIAERTGPLEERIGAIAGVLQGLTTSFGEVDRNLESCVQVFRTP